MLRGEENMRGKPSHSTCAEETQRTDFPNCRLPTPIRTSQGSSEKEEEEEEIRNVVTCDSEPNSVKWDVVLICISSLVLEVGKELNRVA